MIKVMTLRGKEVNIDPAQIAAWEYENDGIYGDPFYRVTVGGKELQLSPEAFEGLKPYLPVTEVKSDLERANEAWDVLSKFLRTQADYDFDLAGEMAHWMGKINGENN